MAEGLEAAGEGHAGHDDSHSRLRVLIENIPVNHILVLIDACFGGTFDRDVESGTTRGGMTTSGR